MRTHLSGAIVVLALACVAQAAAPPHDVITVQVSVLLQHLDADNFDSRQQADLKLRQLGKAVLPMLKTELTRSRSLEVKQRLQRIIKELTLEERVEKLVTLLNNRDPQIRDRAQYNLRMAGPAVLPLLQRELKPSLDETMRQRLTDLIAELAEPR